jgi:hypothetical protein
MGGDHRLVVRDVQQTVAGLHGDLLSGQVAAHVVTVLEDADASGLIDATGYDPCALLGYLLGLHFAVDDLDMAPIGELEAADRGHVADPLVLPVVVVVPHPPVECLLGLLHRGEGGSSEELLAHRLVQPLDLPRGGRRVGGGEEVADPVVQADPVEQHIGRLSTELAGEDLAVVREDRSGTPWRESPSMRPSHTGRAVARETTLAMTQNLE